MRFKAACSFLLLLMSPVLGDEQPAMWGLGTAEYHEVASGTIGRKFSVWVSLPRGYDAESADQYPTLYVLDGGGLFPLVTSYSAYLRFGDEFPAAIIVGVGYPGQTFEEGNYRSTDYTAPSNERDYWGGASGFQNFLATTLMPFIEATYRSDPERRVIFGQSIGGQFVLYTAQTRPDLFWGHIASNPALHRNLEFFLDTVPGEKSGSKLFVASAEFDDALYKEPARAWIAHWQAVGDKPWALEVVELKGHNHMSAPPASLRQGMRWLFRE